MFGTSIKKYSGIRDNKLFQTVGDFLKENIRKDAQLNFVSAYFTINAYKDLKEKLDNIKCLNFLFGEPAFVKIADTETGKQKQYYIQDNNIKLQNTVKQKRIAKECSKWIEEKANIKSIKQTGLLHGKMYHILNENGEEIAILGSSNFTSKGLGFAPNSNIELNLEVQDKRDMSDLRDWFYNIWNDDNLVENVKPKVLNYLKKLYVDNPPELIYFKTLYHLFEEYIKDRKPFDEAIYKTEFTESNIWKKLFDFQKDGVKSAINKINKYNGCIIADSVGLGKTFEALAIIQYYRQIYGYKTLVLCPKKLRSNWTRYLQPYKNNPFKDDDIKYTVLNHTDLSRESGYSGDIDLSKVDWEDYDLLVIDESHNFRNNNTGRKGKQSRYEKLLNEVIKKGRKTKVLLLSATPVNNSLEDLRNQLYIITGDRDDTFKDLLGIPNLKQLISKTKNEFLKWAEQDDKTQEKLLSSLNASFFILLDELTIARSRKHIKKYYKESIEKIGAFPKRHKPESEYSKIDTKDEFPSYDEINDRILKYDLSLFNPTKHLKKEYKELYKRNTDLAQFSQENREKFLIGMMKSNFLKRLESSVNSFRITLGNTLNRMDELKEKINNLSEYDIEEESIINDDENDNNDVIIPKEFEIGKKLKYNLKHLNTQDWLKDIEKDEIELRYLFNKAQDITPDRDAKLQKLIKKIENKIQNPTVNKCGNPNKKVIVFTAFSDTAKYIYENIKGIVKNKLNTNIALVTGSSTETTFGKNNYEDILTNFSPIAKERDSQEDEQIDVLIATDCISEGQNLHDCDYLINYDIHWNPVRLIQRFGRIDRIGSPNNYIQMVNFWATEDLDKYINLKRRVEDKMMLHDISSTNADNILRPDEVEFLKQELKYREKQLKRMKEEILDLEDFKDNVTLTDFSLEDFRIELWNYIQANKEKLEKLPIGINAVTSKENHKEGIIFCLRQKNSSKLSKKINPLQPCFLVYITFNNEIKYTFVNAPKILEIYRNLCIGKDKADEELYNLFDIKTNNGKNMQQCSDLLCNAALKTKERFDMQLRKAVYRQGIAIPDKTNQINDINDFELITWLVIIGKE